MSDVKEKMDKKGIKATGSTIKDQIKLLMDKEAQIKARRQLLEAKEQTKIRKERERRIFLLGTAIEAAVKRGEISQDQVNRWLETGITRAWDREFLGLPKLPEK